MARRRSSKRTKASKAPVGQRKQAGEPTVAPELPITLGDLRMGVFLFLLLEAATYVVLWMARASWLEPPELAVWRYALVTVSIVVLGAVVGLWLAGSRNGRSGWILLLAVVWLVVVVGRVVPLFMLGGRSTPTLLTMYVGQLAVGLMLPAAIREHRKTI